MSTAGPSRAPNMSQPSFGSQTSTLHTIPYPVPPPAPGSGSGPSGSTGKSHRNSGRPSAPQQQQQQQLAQTFIHHVEEVHMPVEESKKDRKERKTREAAEKLIRHAQEQWEKRDEIFTAELSLPTTGYQSLTSYPPTNANFQLALYEISLVRAAALAQLDKDEEYALESALEARDDERRVIEDEWRKGREEARAKMVQGLAEGRKKAKEELDAQDIAELSHDSLQPRPTRKLRGQAGSGPPSPPNEPSNGDSGGKGDRPALPLPPILEHAAAILGWSGPPETNSLSLTNGIPSRYTLPLAITREAKRPKGFLPGSNGKYAMGKAVPLLDRKNDGELEADMALLRSGGKKRRVVLEKDRLGSTTGTADR